VEKIGVKKEIDKLGRICIPKEMRRLFNLENEVELQITNEGILLKNPEYVLVKKEEYKNPDIP
jgi:AbrB family looped-hinge helix DNA binding protein